MTFAALLSTRAPGDVLATELDPDSAAARPGDLAVCSSTHRRRRRAGGFTDLSTRRVLSFPVAERASQSVLDLYSDVAESLPDRASRRSRPGRWPTSSTTLGALGRYKRPLLPELDGLIGQEQGRTARAGRYLDRQQPLAPTQRERLAFVQAHRFYDRPGSATRSARTMAPPPPKVAADRLPRLRRLSAATTRSSCGRSGWRSTCSSSRPAIRPRGPDPGRVRRAGGVRAWMTRGGGARPWTRLRDRDRRFLARPRETRRATWSTGRCGSSQRAGSWSTRSTSTAAR